MEDMNFTLTCNSENFLRYISQAPIGYLILDQQGNILDVNSLFLYASLYSKKDLLNQSYHKLFVFDGTKEEFINQLDSYSQENHVQVVWKDLHQQTRYSKVMLYRSANPALFILCFIDIQKEKNLNLLSRFAEHIFSEINIGLIMIDKNFVIVEISPLACKILNVAKDEAINRSIEEVFIGISDEQRIVQRALLDGITVTNHALTWKNHQQRYDLLIDSNTIKDDSGMIIGAYVVFKDVTNLRSLEQQVQQNDRLATIGQVAAGTAHEIRNPLTSIKGFLQFLKRSLTENGLTEELSYTDIMLSEIERINKLVNEILLLSKPKDAVYKPLDINEILKEIFPIIHNESLLHGVEAKYILNSSLPYVIADSELLKQVFLNIAKNGIEAMQNEGVLTITTKSNQETKQVEIFIHDTGPGIPNYIADKIFDPFFTTKETGTGLGLSISQKIIHDLGGTIRVSTKGFGTTFQIFLPSKY